MRLRKKRWARPELLESSLFIEEPTKFKGKWNEVFSNNNEISLELGCGKGKFISELAYKNQHKNYIAIDLKDEVLVYVKRKCEELNIKNVRIISMEISYITDVFYAEEVSDIYLNFSTPWPKSKHNKRRLTHPRFLDKYKEFIKDGSKIYLKTDHTMFFLDSLEYFNDSSFVINYKSMDFHKEQKENIMTEYEEKFSSNGMKIMYLEAQYEKGRDV